MIKRSSVIKSVLIIQIILQIALWAYTKKEVQQKDLLPQLLPLLIFISVVFWGQVVLLIKYPNEMDRINKFLYPFRPNLIKGVRKRQRVGVIFGLVVVVIMFIAYAVLVVSYVCSHFLWIMNHFAKVTKLFGLVTLLSCISIIIWSVYEGKKRSEKAISKDSIITIGLLVENIIISMILIIS